MLQPRQRAQNVLPCTVAQVLAAEQQDDRFLVGSSELHQVCFNPYSAGINFSRQNLTSADVRF